MINEKDLLTRLQNGENFDDIVKEVTESLNRANKVYEEEVAAKAAKEAEAKAIKEAQLQEYATMLVQGLRGYMRTKAPEVFEDETAEKALMEGTEVAEIRKLLDTTIGAMSGLATAIKNDDLSFLMPFMAMPAPKSTIKVEPNLKAMTDEEILKKFLSAL